MRWHAVGTVKGRWHNPLQKSGDVLTPYFWRCLDGSSGKGYFGQDRFLMRMGFVKKKIMPNLQERVLRRKGHREPPTRKDTP